MDSLAVKKTLPVICVLMCTYNGEKYLQEQIESILRQEDVEVHLFVRDDGSCDSTSMILEAYSERLEYYIDDSHLGAPNGFMKLLYSANDYDYYAFADQDDIWFPNKLKKAVDSISNCKVPALYCSNQYIYRNGVNEGLRFENPPDYSLFQSICGNSISGCTFVFNRQLKEVLCKKNHRPDSNVLNIRMHDVWVLCCATISGDIYYDNNSYMFYRIHDSNTVGLSRHPHKDRLLSLKRRFGEHGRMKLSKELLKLDIVNKEHKEIINRFAFYQNSIKGKMDLITLMNNSTCSESRILFFLKVIIGWI